MTLTLNELSSLLDVHLTPTLSNNKRRLIGNNIKKALKLKSNLLYYKVSNFVIKSTQLRNFICTYNTAKETVIANIMLST